MNIRKFMIAVVAAAAAIGAFADAPTISNVKAQQRYPWNGLVDIDYTITGDTTGLNLSFSARDAETGATCRPRTFLSVPSSSAGTNRATWNPKADGYSIVSTNIVVTVLLTRTIVPPEPTGELDMVQLWEGGPYWATINIGAEKPWDSGYYFWWGDTVGYSRSGGMWDDYGQGDGFVDYYYNVTWVSSTGQQMSSSPFMPSSCPTYREGNSALQSAGYIDSTGKLVAAHDAAHVHWGGAWRMPTKAEMDALDSNCDWTWATTNGVNGYIVRGKDDYASNSIFLPCVGYGDGTSLNNADSFGYYWSSVPNPNNGDYNAWDFEVYSSGHGKNLSSRYYGQCVRPVQGFTE